MSGATLARSTATPAAARSSGPVVQPAPQATTFSHARLQQQEKTVSASADANDLEDLSSLLEKSHELTKQANSLNSSTGARQERSRARAVKRASRAAKSAPRKDKDLPVYTTARRSNRQRSAAQRRTHTAAEVRTDDIPSPVTSAAVMTSDLSARRSRRAQAWGRPGQATEGADEEESDSALSEITSGSTTSLKAKEELELTKKLQKYFKLKDRYDKFCQDKEYEPDMDEFAKHLGTERADALEIIMANGPKQKAIMIRHNMGLVHSICQKYNSEEVGPDELQSAAIEGLVRATQLFDPSKGFKFSTYAHWWIRQAVNKALSTQSRVIYTPQPVYELAIKAQSLSAQLAPAYGGHVPDSVLAEELGIKEKKLQSVRMVMSQPVSLNAPMKADGNSEIQDTIEDSTASRADDVLVKESIEEAIEEYLTRLPSRDSCILRMRYGLGGFQRPHTLEEIGFRYAVTRERIRQIEVKAKAYLRRSTMPEELSEYAFDEEADLFRTSSAVGRKSA